MNIFFKNIFEKYLNTNIRIGYIRKLLNSLYINFKNLIYCWIIKTTQYFTGDY